MLAARTIGVIPNKTRTDQANVFFADLAFLNQMFDGFTAAMPTGYDVIFPHNFP